MPDYYFIKSMLNSSNGNNNVIDILHASPETGTGVDAWPQKSSGTDNQLWEFVPSPITNYFLIKSKLNGLILQVPPDNPPVPGLALDVSTSDDVSNAAAAPHQLWQFCEDPLGSGYFYIISKLNGFVIDIMESSTKPGTLLDLYPPKPLGLGTGENQLWQVVGGSFPSPVHWAPAPTSGLKSNSNYVMVANCANLTDISLTVHVTEDIVTTDAFGFQLNACSPKGSYVGAQQYCIRLNPQSTFLECVVNNWTSPTANDALIYQTFPFETPPIVVLPAGSVLDISLQNDASGNITGAQYSAFDNNGKQIGAHTFTLTELNTMSGCEVGPDDLAPIVCFMVVLVGWGGGASTRLSSGAGSMTMTSSAKGFQVSDRFPPCIDFFNETLETANSAYGLLPGSPNGSFTQTFNAATGGR
jgi:hypothetical protein